MLITQPLALQAWPGARFVKCILINQLTIKGIQICIFFKKLMSKHRVSLQIKDSGQFKRLQ